MHPGCFAQLCTASLLAVVDPTSKGSLPPRFAALRDAAHSCTKGADHAK
jgi:hypothetical protein